MTPCERMHFEKLSADWYWAALELPFVPLDPLDPLEPPHAAMASAHAHAARMVAVIDRRWRLLGEHIRG